MKRLTAILLALCACVMLVFTSCGDDDESKEIFDKWVDQISGESKQPIYLTEEQIAESRTRINESFVTLKGEPMKGDIKKVAQIQKNKMFGYVLEFEYEDDAKIFYSLYEGREDENYYAKISGRIVAYGNNPVIESLK